MHFYFEKKSTSVNQAGAEFLLECAQAKLDALKSAAMKRLDL